MLTSEEIMFVLHVLLLNFMKEFESMKSTKRAKDFRRKILTTVNEMRRTLSGNGNKMWEKVYVIMNDFVRKV